MMSWATWTLPAVGRVRYNPRAMRLNGGEMRAVNEVRDALSSSLDLGNAWSAASPILFRVLPADYAALCFLRPGSPAGLDWIVSQMPARFLEAYPDMAPDDFVFRAVLASPNRVVRDSEMISRRELEANIMYCRARDLGMPLEQVMSTLLQEGGGWGGGISLYRAERRPFSERDCRVLEELIPAFRNSLRNCRLHGELLSRARTWEALLSRAGCEAALVAPSGTELERSPGLTKLLEKWFSPSERSRGGLPDALVRLVLRREPGEFRRTSGPHDLVVRVYSPPVAGAGHTALLFEEVPNTLRAPRQWRKRLTRGQFEVADRVVRGWDNRLVAEDLGRTELTVKTHLNKVFQKLGVDSRALLTSLAFRSLFGEGSLDRDS